MDLGSNVKEDGVCVCVGGGGGGGNPLAEGGVSAVGFIESVLPLHHHAQVLIVEDEYLGGQLVHRHSGQLLHIVTPQDEHHFHNAILSFHRSIVRP